MAYEPVEGLEIHEEEKGSRSQRNVLGALAILALLIVLVLVLLMLPRCSSDGRSGTGDGEGKRIVAVPDTLAEPGVISIWISGDTTIEAALAEAGMRDASATDLGGGRYVVDVERGTERASVRKLRDTAGVHDAGFVFPEADEETAQ